MSNAYEFVNMNKDRRKKGPVAVWRHGVYLSLYPTHKEALDAVERSCRAYPRFIGKFYRWMHPKPTYPGDRRKAEPAK